jgi:hypothetical protein
MHIDALAQLNRGINYYGTCNASSPTLTLSSDGNVRHFSILWMGVGRWCCAMDQQIKPFLPTGSSLVLNVGLDFTG